jgi:hypothetical protein
MLACFLARTAVRKGGEQQSAQRQHAPWSARADADLTPAAAAACAGAHDAAGDPCYRRFGC